MNSASDTAQPTNNLSGFILTRQQRDNGGILQLVYWAATDQGPVRLVLHDQECVCFIAATDLKKARNALSHRSGWRHAHSSLLDFQRQQVAVLYFSSPRALYEARDMLTARNIIVYEADVRPVDRFLMERFITGGIEVAGSAIGQEDYLEYTNPQLRSADYKPRLSCISLDIETQFRGAPQLYSIGVYAEDQQVVFMVDETGHNKGNETLRLYGDEEAMLRAFFAWLADCDPDIIIGWNVVNFDLRYLQETCDRLHLTLDLGRNGEAVSWRQARDNTSRYFVMVPGRVVLDGIELMRTATYNFENFSLQHVAQEVLARGKLVDDVDQRGEEITRLFETDKQALADYNLEDCKLVWEIFNKEQLIEFAIERSQLTGLEMNRYGGSVAAFDFLYLPRLHRAGYVAPALGQVSSPNLSPGGYVMDSIPGFYQHVIVLDFKSLYPSIIRTFHVDPLALVEGQVEADPIEGFDGGVFSRTRFLLPELIENLWQARDRAKATGNKVLSQAIKIIMNSFYGVLGTNGCRFFDPRLVSSITRRGHQVIKESKDYIEQCGYRVIYGDTDSVFVLTGVTTAEAVDAIGRDLADRLNSWWIEKLARGMQVESCLEIEFETHFHRFLMPTVRGADTGSKKRYAGLVRSGPGEQDYRLVFKGLEAVRSDWSPLARRFQRELYERIFLDQPFEEYILQTVIDLENGERDQELLLRRRLRRRLADYVKNVPPHVQAARKETSMREQRGLPALNEQGGWIEYLMTVNGPEPRKFQQSPIDYEFYIERQITPIADSILVFKSTSMKELLDKQIELF
jgi:DNA polymerase-2